MKIRSAVFAVCIMRENILFLEEWIQHHIKLGFEHIFMYDNSKSQVGYGHRMKIEGVTKRGINYLDATAHLTDEDIAKQLLEFQKSYPVTILEWSPLTSDGRVHHFQFGAVQDFVSKFKHEVDYVVHIDIDEFVVVENLPLNEVLSSMDSLGIGKIHMLQHQYLDRWIWKETNPGFPLLTCNTIVQNFIANKNEKCLFKLSSFHFDETQSVDSWRIHDIPIQPEGKIMKGLPQLFFKHFNSKPVIM